jgi:molybdopterin/thiamine biosynthesis adenylyltransferase
VGIAKVTSCQKFYAKIAPWLHIEAAVEQFTLDDAPRLLEGNPDWVLDCIDNITTKVDLLTYCKKNDLKVRMERYILKLCFPMPFPAHLFTTFSSPGVFSAGSSF